MMIAEINNFIFTDKISYHRKLNHLKRLKQLQLFFENSLNDNLI